MGGCCLVVLLLLISPRLFPRGRDFHILRRSKTHGSGCSPLCRRHVEVLAVAGCWKVVNGFLSQHKLVGSVGKDFCVLVRTILSVLASQLFVFLNLPRRNQSGSHSGDVVGGDAADDLGKNVVRDLGIDSEVGADQILLILPPELPPCAVSGQCEFELLAFGCKQADLRWTVNPKLVADGGSQNAVHDFAVFINDDRLIHAPLGDAGSERGEVLRCGDRALKMLPQPRKGDLLS